MKTPLMHYIRKRNHQCFKLESEGEAEAGRRGVRWEKVTLDFYNFRHLKGLIIM